MAKKVFKTNPETGEVCEDPNAYLEDFYDKEDPVEPYEDTDVTQTTPVEMDSLRAWGEGERW